MKIPKITKDKPYIKFAFDKKGNLKLSTDSSWFGGKQSGFICSDGTEGNTCEPKDLNAYIKAFQKRKIKNIEQKIISLKKQLEIIKKSYQ